MKRYEMRIVRQGNTEVKKLRAVNVGSIEGMAEDLMRDDKTIKYIQIDDGNGNVITVR